MTYLTRICLAAVVALMALGACAFDPQHAALRYSDTELAFVAELARIHDVERLDVDGAIASGRNACYWISEFGLDPVTLAGWEEYWHEPWERQWLEAAVTNLCPPTAATAVLRGLSQ